MTITALPTPPTTADPTNFATRADAFLAALPTFATETNAVGVQATADAATAAAAAVTAGVIVTSQAYMATCNTSQTVNTSGRSVTLVEASRGFANGDRVTIKRRSDPNCWMTGPVTLADMTAKTMTVTPDTLGPNTGGPYTDWVVFLAALGSTTIGKQAMPIPARAMTSRPTNGPAAGQVETTTNKVVFDTLDFDASTIEYAQFAMRMPKSWNESTVSAVFEWSHAATVTNFKVSWGLQGVAISDGDAGDAAFGTAIYTNDTGGTTNTCYASPETAAVTIAGSPAAEDWVVFQVLRKADDATNDTLTIDARLHGITLYFTTDAGTDA